MSQLRTALNDVNRFSGAVNTSIGKLAINEPYKVERLEKVTTKYGPSVIAYLTKGGEDLCKVYLPKKFTNVIDDEFIEKFNRHEVGELFLTYRGMIDKSFNVKFS
jgi:hypothetical protein